MDHRDTAARPAGSGTGPRQEYLDAFDEGGYGRPDPAPGGAGASRAADGGDPEGGAQQSGQAPASGGRHAGPARHGRRRAGAEQRRTGGKGRTITGVAAAAVVTVLAVVVAGQVTGHGGEAASPLGAGADERAPASAEPGAGTDGGTGAGEDGTPPPAEEEPAEPTYDELMETMFTMDPAMTGSGELVPVAGSDPAADPDATTVLRYRVDVEEGIGLDPEFFAEVVHRTLNDPRSWGNGGERSFARVSAGDYDFIVTLASPGTAADWCARSNLDITEDNVSCNSSFTERVIINAWRWAQGSETYGDDISGYRQMLINHEVGHRLGYGHALCPAEGALAPVMMQQTKFLETEGLTCEPNPWPHPES